MVHVAADIRRCGRQNRGLSFVVETKHWTGVVSHGETDDAVMLTPVFGQRFVRTSPIKQSAAKLRFLRNLLPPRLWAVEGFGPFSMKR
ncbi:hypothetical protein GS910_19285 [Paraburkholderia sp. RL16-012-BIC-B]|nr:hypothetical protein [Paraburkholderia madseniana]